MTLNTKAKGQRKELLARKELQSEGWTVLFQSYTIKMGPIYKGIDFADLFDIVAVKKERWKFVSVTHRGAKNDKEHKQLIRDFIFNHIPSMAPMDCEYWVWNPARWKGLGKKRAWSEAHWEKTTIGVNIDGDAGLASCGEGPTTDRS